VTERFPIFGQQQVADLKKGGEKEESVKVDKKYGHVITTRGGGENIGVKFGSLSRVSTATG